MIIKYQKENILVKLFIIFSFGICWLSISTSIDDLFILENYKELNIKLIINFFRQTLIYFCFFFCFILLFFFNRSFFQKKNLAYIIFGIYFLAQIPGLIYSENKFENIYLVFSALTAILTMILIERFFSKDEKKILIIISFFILMVVFLMTLIPQLKLFLSGKQIFYGSLMRDSEIFFGKDSPRSSGSSRICLLLIILFFILDHMLSNKIKFITKFFVVTLLSMILLYQSRTIIFLSIVTFFLIFIYENNFSFKKIFKFICLYFVIPFLVFLSLISNYYTNYKKVKVFSWKEHKENHLIIKKENFSQNQIDVNDNSELPEKKTIKDYLILRQSSDFSSGRFDDWKEIYMKFSIENIFFGYGSQGDRYLINQSASNALVYAISSSGIFGLIFFILFSIIIIKKTSEFIINFKKIDFNQYYFSLIILIIFLRSILESSYSVYGIDFMIVITSICFINNFKSEN